MDNKNTVVALDLNTEETYAYNEDIQVMCALREEFNAPRVELDGMNRAQYYENNRKLDLSYIPPKKNKQDVRIVTGTTREKDTTLLSTLMNLNTQPDVTAFDEEDMVVAELGDNMSDLIKKSREIEDWDKKKPIIIREMISQGDVFVEETFIEDFRDVPIGEVLWDPTKDGASPLSFKKRLQRISANCHARMVKGNMVYLGDMTIEYIEDQDIVAICTILPRSVAAARYGQWERWKNVPYVIANTEQIEYSGGMYSPNHNWAMFGTRGDQVSEVKLFKVSSNSMMIYLNGIPMMPYNFPLTALYPSGELPFAQGKLEPISGFALSKSQPSKTKVDQAVIDEITMLFVEAFRTKRKPPMGTKTDKVYSPGIFAAGTITPEVDANTFHSILPESALRFDASEFSFYSLIKESINEKTTNDVYSGEGQEGVDTLGQAEIMKQQQMLKLGAAVDGLVNLERRLAWNRIDNIIINWTAPIDTKLKKTKEGVLETINSYRKLSVETSLPSGEAGLKTFRLQDKEFPGAADIYEEEEALTKQQGKPVRISYLSPQQLRAKRYYWFIIVNPTPKSNDKLSQLLYVQNVRTAMELFGPESLNLEYAKQRFAILINEDYTKFFKQMDIMQMFEMGLMGDNAAGTVPGRSPDGTPAAPVRKTNTRPLRVAAQ